MNTRFSYVYQDGTGHRYFGERVFAGGPESELITRLRCAMEQTENPGTYRFIAEQAGLPSLFPWVVDTPGTETVSFRPSTDSVWHEVNLGEGENVEAGIMVSDDDPTDGRSFEQFVRSVEQASADGWKPEEALRSVANTQPMESVDETRQPANTESAGVKDRE